MIGRYEGRMRYRAQDVGTVGTVANGIILRNGAVLLCKRSPEKQLYPDRWGLPGGHVERGEAIRHALIRELREELGVTATLFNEFEVIGDTTPGSDGEMAYHIYLISAWEGGEPLMLGDEHTEIRWFDIDAACELDDLALHEYKQLFHALRNGFSGCCPMPLTAPTA